MALRMGLRGTFELMPGENSGAHTLFRKWRLRKVYTASDSSGHLIPEWDSGAPEPHLW
jgi:hypothetical protein